MNKKALLLIFATAIISGVSIFINKYSVSVINPYIFTFLKNMTVALFLSSLIFLIKDWKTLLTITKKQWVQLVSIGLIGGCIPFLLFFKGLSLTSAMQGAFIHKTLFIYTAILAIIFLKEKINKKFLIGAILLLIGNLIALKTIPTAIGKGELLIFIATLFWAFENLISKYTLKTLPASIVAWSRMFFGSIFIFTFLIFTKQASLVLTLTSGQIVWTLITAILLFGYVLTWYSGLKYVPLSTASAVLVFGSVITTLLSFIATGNISLQSSISSLFILLGVMLIVNVKFSFQKVKNQLSNN